MVLGEFYWKQRSRSEWLKSGDRNTKFFHSKASQWIHKNEIRGLENSQAEWVQDKNGIVIEIENYFCNIFSRILPDDVVINLVLKGVERRVTSKMSE